jgi:hypothetical protein
MTFNFILLDPFAGRPRPAVDDLTLHLVDKPRLSPTDDRLNMRFILSDDRFAKAAIRVLSTHRAAVTGYDMLWSEFGSLIIDLAVAGDRWDAANDLYYDTLEALGYVEG